MKGVQKKVNPEQLVVKETSVKCEIHLLKQKKALNPGLPPPQTGKLIPLKCLFHQQLFWNKDMP